MTDVTEAGRIFIREGTLLPETLHLESEPYASWIFRPNPSPSRFLNNRQPGISR